MASTFRGCWYLTAALVLILSSVTTIVLTGINLHNLMQSNPFINTLQFTYQGEIGDAKPFCSENSFVVYGNLCGFLTIPAFFTGIFACAVKKTMSKFALFFLIFSGITAFITSLITAIVTALILFCHVTLSGYLPSTTLFISIFSVVQSIMSMVCFFLLCTHRSQEAMDLKYGIEPIPDPWQLTVSEAVYVEGKPKFIEDEGPPIFHFLPNQYADGNVQKTIFTGNTTEPAQEKRIILNNPGVRSTPLPPIPRNQIFPAQNIIKPFSIDRVGCPQNNYSQHDLPFNCKPLA